MLTDEEMEEVMQQEAMEREVAKMELEEEIEAKRIKDEMEYIYDYSLFEDLSREAFEFYCVPLWWSDRRPEYDV